MLLDGKEYRIGCAVRARQEPVEGAPSDAGRWNRWAETQGYLDAWATEPPPELACFSETAGNRARANVYLVGPGGVVLWVGEVTRRDIAEWSWRKEVGLAREENDQERVRFLEQGGPFAVDRDEYGCSIGLDAGGLDREALENGIRKYLNAFSPPLAALPCSWLTEDVSNHLDAAIEANTEQPHN